MITKANWDKGIFDYRRKRVLRTCFKTDCGNIFSVIPSDPKKYCSSSCAAKVSNQGRSLSIETRKKISLAVTGIKYPSRLGIIKVPRISAICKNPECKKSFIFERWEKRKYCSPKCAMKIVGGKPTSPKAARGKAGIRLDIDPTSYFYSRWEANYARILNLLDTEWVHQPKVFRLKKQNYTPDFYLPRKKEYIEIKNFLSDYSKRRDDEFRELYPNLKLIMILKDDYLKLQEKYSPLIKKWEFS